MELRGFCRIPTMYEIRLFYSVQCVSDPCLIYPLFFFWPQVDKLEEAESQRKTEEEVTEPGTMVFGRCTGSKSPWRTDSCGSWMGENCLLLWKQQNTSCCFYLQCLSVCAQLSILRNYLCVKPGWKKNGCFSWNPPLTRFLLTGWSWWYSSLLQVKFWAYSISHWETYACWLHQMLWFIFHMI